MPVPLFPAIPEEYCRLSTGWNPDPGRNVERLFDWVDVREEIRHGGAPYP